MARKRTYQASKIHRARKLGFRHRNATAKGRLILKKRRTVGRKRVSL